MEEALEKIISQREKKLEELRKKGIDPYLNQFKPTHSTQEIFSLFGEMSEDELQKLDKEVKVCGRIISKRVFGKASFFDLKDEKGRIQVYVRQEFVGEKFYKEIFKKLFDIGDIVGVCGSVMKTKTGELSVLAKSIFMLSKSLRPLPEKWHGLRDVEIRYRQRYVDLIVNPKVKDIFLKRFEIIRLIRKFFNDRGFFEVETPMMHPVAGGAAARPFKTHHNTLDIDLYLRIAPELYLKRLLVGGFEKIYELNRCFRNEGISTYHNPEFTMLEFYQAYATYKDLIEITESLFVYILENLFGTLEIEYQGKRLDFSPPWRRIEMKEAVAKHFGEDKDKIEELSNSILEKKGLCREESPKKAVVKLFEEFVEPTLFEPTFVVMYPVEVSPLAKRNEKDPAFTDRFELFLAGKEIANGFSELNDPIDQRQRFYEEVLGKEDKEIDEDFLRALEYGMPPAAGEGIGIDRLVMILTDQTSIREVILFPQLRPEGRK